MKFFARVLLPLLLLVYIGVDTFLKINHSSLCEATGCRLASMILRFDPIYLNFMGLGAVAIILVLGWLSLKKKEFEKLFFIALFSAVIFESIMIGAQLFINPTPCIFCLGVYGLLLLILLFSSKEYFMVAIVPLLAIFIALSTLNFAKNEALFAKDGLYLIQSPTCPHCKRVKEFFKKENISYIKVDASNANGWYLARTLNISTIPILVEKRGGKIKIISGDRDIIEYFSKKKNKTNENKENKENKTVEPIPLQKAQGCSLVPITGSGCEDN
ncbi:MAG: hypothetical protein GXO02_02140 [Epsilonproteobacteria bacterium]|nr:hypothetical protein [Campylobacterota bacterium]